MDEYEKNLQSIKEAQAKKLVSDLQAKQNSSLSALNQEEAIAKPQYTQQRADKNVASQIQKLNFAEYMQNRGQQNAGISNTAELSRQNVLSRNIGSIDTAENTQMADISRRKTDVNTAYNTELTSGNMSIEQDIATKMLAYKEQLRQEEAQRQEQLRQEEVQRQTVLRQQQYQAEQDQIDRDLQMTLARMNQKASTPTLPDTSNSFDSQAYIDSLMNSAQQKASQQMSKNNIANVSANSGTKNSALNTISLKDAVNFNKALESLKIEAKNSNSAKQMSKLW